MSRIIFLGLKKHLNKTRFTKNEIYNSLKYCDSLYTQNGILLDNHIEEPLKYHFGRYASEYIWYEVKSMAIPFDCKTKLKEVMPDLYESTYQAGDWFINFLREKIVDGYEPCLLQRWLGDSAGKAIKVKNLSISKLKPENYSIPYDVLLKFEL